jgi:uncharacterized SAM-dependent methyltransferase
MHNILEQVTEKKAYGIAEFIDNSVYSLFPDVFKKFYYSSKTSKLFRVICKLVCYFYRIEVEATTLIADFGIEYRIKQNGIVKFSRKFK